MVEESRLENVEGQITLLLTAIRDKVLIKELVKTYIPDREYTNGRTR